jgi:hypothetical protein
LHLVDQEGDAGVPLPGRLAEGDEQVGQIIAQVAGVGDALDRVGVDSCGDRAV